MEETVFGGGDRTHRSGRPLWAAMRNGILATCPQCGKGRLFSSFLGVVHNCDRCGEDLHHHRADDLPAYLVIVIVGHVVVGAFVTIEASISLSMFQHLAIWVPLTIFLSVALLRPVKGAVIGLQWALGMHGFGDENDEAQSHLELQEP
jgi:uncharacterized protein (DUF983 family)